MNLTDPQRPRRISSASLRPALLLLCAIGLSAGLAACGSSPTRSSSGTAPPAVSNQDVIADANRHYESGRYLAAAELYLQAAETAANPGRQSLLVRAAEAAQRADRLPMARRALKRIDDSQLSPRLSQQALLLRAETGLMRDQPDVVLAGLTPPRHGEDPELAARIWAQRANAHRESGDTVEMVRALVSREAWLQNEPSRLARNRAAIWESLRVSPRLGDDFLYRLDIDPVTRGWLELAVLDRAVWSSARDRQRALDEWQQRYTGHPASDQIVGMIAQQPMTSPRQNGKTGLPPVPPGFPGGDREQAAPAPEQVVPRSGDAVALLLPLTGPFANPARAVRDGFMAAHLASKNPPRLIVLDVTRSDSIMAVYRQARQLGATSIVGPLEKQRVDELAESNQIDAPTLALNYLDAGVTSPSGLFQFGLAPEDDAREAARRMIADGHTVAAMLAPEGDWAVRALRAFQEQFQQLGGRIGAYRIYDDAATDYSPIVKELLNESGHVRRKPGSETAPPAFAVFLVAKPQQARLIRPQFLYHGASQVALYSTSHIYTGTSDPARDADLDGIRFVDTDWSLNRSPEIVEVKEQVRELYPRTFNQYSRLYAFGYDAAKLHPFIAQGRMEPGRYYSAASGVLYLSPDGRIGRRLSWAEFRNGKAQIIDTQAP